MSPSTLPPLTLLFSALRLVHAWRSVGPRMRGLLPPLLSLRRFQSTRHPIALRSPSSMQIARLYSYFRFSRRLSTARRKFNAFISVLCALCNGDRPTSTSSKRLGPQAILSSARTPLLLYFPVTQTLITSRFIVPYLCRLLSFRICCRSCTPSFVSVCYRKFWVDCGRMSHD